MSVRSLAVLVSVLVGISGSTVAAQVVARRPAALTLYELTFQNNRPVTVWIIASVNMDACNHYTLSAAFRKIETRPNSGEQDFVVDVNVVQTLMGCLGDRKARPAQVLKSATFVIHPDRFGTIRSTIYVPARFELIVDPGN